MNYSKRMTPHGSQVLAVILGGGQGTRLFPLTKDRAKPAVPLAGKYRLVDIPISNCINSGLRRVYVLTQFNSASMHRHISQTYKFDHFTGGFVEILAAEQTLSDTSWYQGTADAVRKNLIHLMNHDWEYGLILSGDQLYRMDFQEILSQHAIKGADVTIATIPMRRSEASALGIMQIGEDQRITRFVEKPKDPALLDSLRLDPAWHGKLGLEGNEESFLASMGIYVFNREVMLKLLDNDWTDFGKHIIPAAIQTHRVYSYVFQGYWEDIGTIRSFFEANLELTSSLPRFNFYDMSAPIYTRPRYLPASKINGAYIEHSLIADGCILDPCHIRDSVVGLRTIIGEGSDIHRTVMLGNDYYESLEGIQRNRTEGRPAIGIGCHTRIENAIIDKNARIGNHVTIRPAGKPDNMDHAMFCVRDGVVIIPKNGFVPDGTVI